MEISWDLVLDYYSKNRADIEREARAQLFRGASPRLIAAQHRTYLLAKRYTGRTDVEIPFLDRLAARLALISRNQE